jgi:hypothetical protein
VQAERDDPIRTADRAPREGAGTTDPERPRGIRGFRLTTAPKTTANSARARGGVPVYTTRNEVESLGVSLGPALHDACGDRLGDIEWFQSPWQKSGAATGRTYWRLPDGRVIDAIVKVPVGYREYYWSTRTGRGSTRCGGRAIRVPASARAAGARERDGTGRVRRRVDCRGEGLGRGGLQGGWGRLDRELDQSAVPRRGAVPRAHAEIKPAERTEPAGEPDWRATLRPRADAGDRQRARPTATIGWRDRRGGPAPPRAARPLARPAHGHVVPRRPAPRATR